MVAGRPKKYTSVEEVESIIDEYLDECKEEDNFPTIAGLAYALDMTTQTLREYGRDDKFSCTIKRAKLFVEIAWEKQLLKGGSGAIFWLKNNAGWKDKTEQDVNMKAKFTEIVRKIKK